MTVHTSNRTAREQGEEKKDQERRSVLLVPEKTTTPSGHKMHQRPYVRKTVRTKKVFLKGGRTRQVDKNDKLAPLSCMESRKLRLNIEMGRAKGGFDLRRDWGRRK